MRGQADRPRLWIRVFGAPIIIAVLSLTGLLSALLLGDVGRTLSWIAVGLPVLVCVGAWLRLRRR
jgi:hypothetical protein